MYISACLAVCAICLLAVYTLLRLTFKLLRYKSVKRLATSDDIVDLLTASTYELETEIESQYQLGQRITFGQASWRASLEDLVHEDSEPATELDNLLEALSDSMFFKNLDSDALRAVAEAMRTEKQSMGGLRCDCFYQSDVGVQQLFVLPSSDSAITLKIDCQYQFDVPPSCRVLFSPSSLTATLLSLPHTNQYHCTLHGNFAKSAFWSISYAELSNCLAQWPDGRRKLLQQFWSRVNDVFLLVFVKWLNLDALKFIEATEFDELLTHATDDLVEELSTNGLNFAAMSFYERRPLYKRMALRILRHIADCGPNSAGFSSSTVESEVSVIFHPPGSSVTCRTAFLLLEGRIEAVTHPTLDRQFAQTWEQTKGCRRLPGWVGLMQYFTHSQLPFRLTSSAASNGVIVAELSDRLMDQVFGSPDTPDSAPVSPAGGPFDSATRYLLRQLSPQLYRHDLLIDQRRLHRGDCLVRSGEPADTVEIVLSGRLRHRTAELGRGDCVGLLKCLMGSTDKHCWDVVAVRESRAVSLPNTLARAWVSQNHRLLIFEKMLSSLCSRELDRQQRRSQKADANHQYDEVSKNDYISMMVDTDDESDSTRVSAVETGWINPDAQSGRDEVLIGFVIDPSRFNQPLLLHLFQRCLTAVHGSAARLVSESDVQEHFGRRVEQLPDTALHNWIEEQELIYSTLVFVCSDRVNRWTRVVLGFLDSLIVCCDADAPAGVGEEPSNTELLYARKLRSRVHLAVFHPLTLCPVPTGTSIRFLRHRRRWASRVFHVRCSAGYYQNTAASVPDASPLSLSNSDLARLVRLTTGRAVGLAFGNDGRARGLANLGALEALLAEGVAVDAVSGSGTGAVSAAAWALHNGDLRATRQAVRRLWSSVDGLLDRLRDLTLPLVSAYTGARLNAAMRDLFGPRRQVEDLWLPCIVVSTDLIAARSVAHTCGTLWRCVRASCGRVGTYPPVWEPRTGRLLVDGSHTDRLPARTLRQLSGVYRVVAVALNEHRRSLRLGNYLVFGDHVSGWRELLRSWNPFRLAPLAPAAADIQAALASLAAAGENPDLLDDKEEEKGVPEDDGLRRWCLTVLPDASFSTSEDCGHDERLDMDRCRGYWSARRRLRRAGAGRRAALRGANPAGCAVHQAT